MPNQKRDRQWVSSRAKAAAAQAAQRRRARRRLGAALAAGVLVLAIIGGAVFVSGGSSTKPSAVSTPASGSASPVSSTTSTAPLPSAAGKPCVAVNGPVPAGAPAIPIPVGPPPDHLVIQDLKPGTGAAVGAGQTLTVNYVGASCSTGKVFDSSYGRGQTADFQLANVIQGWQQGMPGMKVGGERLLGIPPSLAYGANPPPQIAPDETLWFVIDLVNLK
ncbi:MAG TPA: FKBP-type peptidyl-prolyl cis-trans isomerase [Acidimicrobiales bacterium]|nr:FKBP-type peptidyl-prolyl cis-trans isomerase [Acidimicrobiales bacterium]